MSRRGERGNVAIIVALTLVILLGFAALVIDFGNIWNVRGELQNAADAAALGGVRDLDGNPDNFVVARTAAQRIAGVHAAAGTRVEVDLNVENAVPGDVVLGRWSFAYRAFTPDDGTLAPYRVNAVQVTTRRSTGDGNPVRNFLGPLFGRPTQDVVTTAIAVGGSPSGTCAFPLAVTDCSILQPDGTIACNQKLTFGQATTDTVGFTLLSDENPTTPTVTCMMARDLIHRNPGAGIECPKSCDCTQTCNTSSVEDGLIKISNGNNLSSTSVDNIVEAVAAAGPEGVLVNVPVLDSGGLAPSECGGFNYNQLHEVVGYMTMKLTAATFAPDKAVYAEVQCTESGPIRPGGSFFGYKSSTVYLVR